MPIIGNISPTNVNIDGQPILVDVNGQPLSVRQDQSPEASFVTTVPYTVPTGRWARVTPMGVWFEHGGNVFGFEKSTFTLNSGGSSGGVSESLMTNTTDQDLMVEALFVSGDINPLSADYVALFAGDLSNPARPLGELGPIVANWEGVGDYKYVMVGSGGSGKTHDSWKFRLPPGHTLRRAWAHPGGGEITVTAVVWSETVLKGVFNFEAGQDVDGDKFFVEQFLI